MLKSIPIIMSADSVRAILSGRKTETRRLAVTKAGKPALWTKLIPGDVLWVREPCHNPTAGQVFRSRWHRDADASPCRSFNNKGTPGKRPAVRMPRRDCRLELTVVETRAEHLQEITEEAAVREGVVPEFEVGVSFILAGNPTPASTHVLGFKHVWDRLHGPGSWDANPKVIAIRFTPKVPE